jgi:predicted DNA-binding transcriptional regulator YafY
VRQAPRFFRLDRIDDLVVLNERFTQGERHALAGAPAPSAAQPGLVVEARVRFDPAVVRWVRERQPFMFVREEVDLAGPVFVYAVRDERALLGWLLGWGASVELLDPLGLRARLANEARAITRKHAGATDRMLSGGRAQAGHGA